MVTVDAQRSPDDARRWEPKDHSNVAENCNQSFSSKGVLIFLVARSRVEASATLNMENISRHQVSGRTRALNPQMYLFIPPTNKCQLKRGIDYFNFIIFFLRFAPFATSSSSEEVRYAA